MNNEGPTIFGIMFMYMIKLSQLEKKVGEEIDKISCEIFNFIFKQKRMKFFYILYKKCVTKQTLIIFLNLETF